MYATCLRKTTYDEVARISHCPAWPQRAGDAVPGKPSMSALSAKSLQILQFQSAEFRRCPGAPRRSCTASPDAALNCRSPSSRIGGKMGSHARQDLHRTDRHAHAPRNPTRPVRIGSVTIGGGHPIVVQSMCATKTSRRGGHAWPRSTHLAAAGAGVVRIAVDTPSDAQALAEIRRRTAANLSVDLQENYRLAAEVAPWVDKIRYNPGHLYHHEREPAVAGQGAVPGRRGRRARLRPAGGGELRLGRSGPARAIRRRRLRSARCSHSALEHCELLDRLGFTRYCVSLKDSDPAKVVEVNRLFRPPAARRAAAPGRDRGGHAAGRDRQDAAGACEQLIPRGSATRFASR